MKTVCAVSTPRGKGGIAVVRVSGDDAFRVALSVFKPKFADIGGVVDKKYFRRALFGQIFSSDDEPVDEGILVLYKLPRVVHRRGHGGNLLSRRHGDHGRGFTKLRFARRGFGRCRESSPSAASSRASSHLPRLRRSDSSSTRIPGTRFVWRRALCRAA